MKHKYSKKAASNPEIDEIENTLNKLEKKLGIEIYAKLENDDTSIKAVITFDKIT